MFAYNCTPHSSTGYAPYCFGTVLPIDNIHNLARHNPDKWVEAHAKCMSQLTVSCRQNQSEGWQLRHKKSVTTDDGVQLGVSSAFYEAS